MQNVTENGQRHSDRKHGFLAARTGTTAIEFGILATPIILMLVGIMEFSVVLWKNSALDNGVLELHRSVRSGSATGADYRSIVCDRAGSIIDCDGKSLVINVGPLEKKSSNTFSEGFSGAADGAFLIRVNYRHSFIVPIFDAVVPGSVLENRMTMYGEMET